MKVVVFGHYDSRGGTAAFQVGEFTPAEYEKAAKKYLEIFFCAKEEELEEMMRVAEEDFLFFAELHGELPEVQEDLEEEGQILIDTTNEIGTDPFSERAYQHIVQLEFVKNKINWDNIDESNASAIKMAKHLAGNIAGNIECRTWNDDAYGFILCP